MARGADLFVVCKNCGSEVSPYVTECPYCGQRVRKRAPKIERTPAGGAREPRGGRRGRGRTATARRPRLGRMRPGEIPGLSAGALSRPWATITLVVACFGVYLAISAGAFSAGRLIVLPAEHQTWRAFTAPFVHIGLGGASVFAGGAYQLATLIGIGIFGWLLERRHGPWVVLALYLLAGAGGMLAVIALDPSPFAFGANGLALGLLAAWAMPDILAWRRDEDWEGDLLGTGVIAAVLLLLPLALDGASAIAGLTGLVAGIVVGYPLARASAR
jgi:membrane associated rhomboid family serine protease